MSATCPRCGGRVSEVDALCPDCLKRVALRESADFEEAAATAVNDLLPESAKRKPSSVSNPPGPVGGSGERWGDYELIELIGRGAMGTVFKARHVRLNRLVALKLISQGGQASETQRKRFVREAEAVARLQHPHIVTLYETGEVAGQPFLAMEYVAGKTLDDSIARNPLAPRRAAECLKKVSEAVHYAHERGVLHRDLKPSNVTLDSNDEPRVMDFGLARLLEQESELTLSGMAIGSPSYMAPEQAAGKVQEISAASDVYSLGAMLYEALTGRPPFQADSAVETMRQVVENEPVSPHLLNARIPLDLTTICLKCLEKTPVHRYGSAKALAEELGRYLNGEPILARPISAGARAWRWCRRNPALFATGAFGLSAALLGFSGVVWQWRSAERHRQNALQAQANEQRLRRRAEVQELAAQKKAYASDMKLLQQALAVDDLGRAQELLDRQRPGPGEPDIRGWEWRYCWQFCQSDAAFTLCRQSNSILSVSFSGDGGLLAVGPYLGNEITVWDVASRQVVFSDKEPPDTQVRLAFAPGGDTLAYYNTFDAHKVVLWNSRTKTEGHKLPFKSFLRELAFTTNGWLFTDDKSVSNNVTVWNVADGTAVNRFTARAGGADMGTVFAVTRNGSRVAHCVADDARFVRVADVEGDFEAKFQVTDELVTALAFSPDGQTLLTGSGYSDGAIKLWDISSRRFIGSLEGHRSWVSCLKFLPGGKTLASASADRTIRLWNFETRQPVRTLRGYGGELWTIDVSPDGRWLASGGKDGSVMLWNLDSSANRPPAYRTISSGSHSQWSFSPDGKRLAVRWRSLLRLYDAITLKLVGEQSLPMTNINHMVFAPDPRLLFLADAQGYLGIWDLQERRLVTNFKAHSGPAFILRSDLDKGRRALTVSGREIKEWDVGTWKETGHGTAEPGMHMWVAASEANLMATGNRAGVFDLIPLYDLEKRRRFNGQSRISAMEFSPDGKTFVASSENGTVEIWDTETLSRRALLRGVLLGYHSVATSADGERVAAGSNGQEAIKIFDLHSCEEVGTLAGQGSSFTEAAFCPDGNAIGAFNWKRALHVWRAPSWEEIAAAERARPALSAQ